MDQKQNLPYERTVGIKVKLGEQAMKVYGGIKI
jgi:hypothetical protein